MNATLLWKYASRHVLTLMDLTIASVEKDMN